MLPIADMTKINIKNKPGKESGSGQSFDLEMLYVECSRCGRPLIWEKGATTFLIQHSGIDKNLDSNWLLLSKGCPSCSPGQNEFVLTLARPGNGFGDFPDAKIRFN